MIQQMVIEAMSKLHTVGRTSRSPEHAGFGKAGGFRLEDPQGEFQRSSFLYAKATEDN